MATVVNSVRKTAYGQSQPLINVFNEPIVSPRAPLTKDKGYPLGTIWIDSANGNAYILTEVANNSATWVQIALSVGGGVSQLTATDNGAVVLPAGGNINITGDNTTISATGAGSTITFGLVNSPVIVGGLTVTGL